LVGTRMMEVLEERRFPVTEFFPVASERSLGRKVKFAGKEYSVISAGEAIAKRPDLAIFSAGSGPSKELAPKFAAVGCRVVDNSSCWRMDPTKKLVVPEVNADVLTEEDMIIANPNCSTIQMMLPLDSIHKAYGIKRLVISTYQSVTGAGQKAIYQFEQERAGAKWGDYKAKFPWPIDCNILPHIGDFEENGYTTEEMKMVNETRKILRDDTIAVTATTARVPVVGGHSESINVETARPFELSDIRAAWEKTPGMIVEDDPSRDLYPMPIHSYGKDEVFVGRLRRDFSIANGLNFWCVSDNIRKGAATNAVQIAQVLLEKGYLRA